MRGQNQNGDEWLQEQFEFEYCAECGGDWYDHYAVMLCLGAYGCNLFAYCKVAIDASYKVRQKEAGA
nr:hypothetical protein [uncultured Nitrososphaera sp.]